MYYFANESCERGLCCLQREQRAQKKAFIEDRSFSNAELHFVPVLTV